MAKGKESLPAETEKARKVLSQARDSVEGFLKAFETVRKARNAKATTTDEEQDLLRATLVFAAAGLDAVTKELIRGSIRALAAMHSDVQTELETFVQRQLRGDAEEFEGVGGTKFLARVLVAPAPQEKLIELYVLELTGSSLQSADQLIRATKALGLKPSEMMIDPKKLTPLFRVRNKIIHELDVNLDQTRARRNQNSRTRGDMEDNAKVLLRIADNLVNGVNQNLKSI